MTAHNQRVLDLLSEVPTRGLDGVRELFCTELNYAYCDETLPVHRWPQGVQDSLAEPPRVIAHSTAPDGFEIIYVRLAPEQVGRTFPLSIGAERRVVERLLSDNHAYALFVFSDSAGEHWHLVNVRYDTDTARRRLHRRIAVGAGERLRTAAERVAMLDLAALDDGLPSLLSIQERHDVAFDVEAVTDAFYQDYRRIFEATEGQITGLDGEDLRLFTQRLFNRLLFIAFIERKGWLHYQGRTDYLAALWEAHDEAGGSFYRERLRRLFFSGLNNPQDDDEKGAALVSYIGSVPYLNGGLFEEEPLDRLEGVEVPDEVFGPIFDDLIYHYNFTVTEATPLDVEVAVDPEMLGRIFEELVTSRHESGSYYTPKTVVAFMCREALKGYLADVCPDETAEAITAFVDEQDAGAPSAIVEGIHELDDGSGRKPTIWKPPSDSDTGP
jgi:hypothetical protein